MELSRAILRNAPAITWTTLLRADAAIDDGLATEVCASGCRLIALGVESGSARVLDAMGKGIAAEQAAGLIRTLDAAGIAVIAYFIFGHPRERLDDVRLTLEFIEQNRQHLFSYTMTPFAVTTNAPVFIAPGRYGMALDGAARDLTLFDLMRCDGHFRWRPLDGHPVEDERLEIAELLDRFQRRQHNFFDDRGQFFPLRTPPDVLWSFLLLSAETMRPGPGPFADPDDLGAAIPFFHLGRPITEVFSAGRVRMLPEAGGAFPGETGDIVCARGARRLPRCSIAAEDWPLLCAVDGRRSVAEIAAGAADAARAKTTFAFWYHQHLIALRAPTCR